jgi:hypothetical protein
MAKKNRQETPAEFRARMLSIGYMPHGRTKDKIRTITRPIEEGGVDAGKRAKQTKDELGNIVTTSDNRQDVDLHPETVYQTLELMQGL